MPPLFTANASSRAPSRGESPAPRSGCASPLPSSGYASPVPGSGYASPRPADLVAEVIDEDGGPWYLNGGFEDEQASSKSYPATGYSARRSSSRNREGGSTPSSFTNDYMGRPLKPGDAITALRSLYKTQGGDLEVRSDWRGIISKVDAAGDVLVDFGGEMPLRWVRKKHVSSLRRAGMDELSGIPRREWSSRESSLAPSPCPTPQRLHTKEKIKEKPVPSRIAPLKEDSSSSRGRTRSLPSDPSPAIAIGRIPSTNTVHTNPSFDPADASGDGRGRASLPGSCSAPRRFPRFTSCFVRS